MWNLITQVPGGAGEVKLTAVTLPTPTWQAEPTADTGYTKGTDASADENSLTPKLLISYVNVTRVMDVLQPQFWTEVAMIAENAMMEQVNRALLETASSDAPTGMYNFTGVGSSANLSAAPSAGCCWHRIGGVGVVVIWQSADGDAAWRLANPPGRWQGSGRCAIGRSRRWAVWLD